MSTGSREGSIVSINKQLWKHDMCDLLDVLWRDDRLVGVQDWHQDRKQHQRYLLQVGLLVSLKESLPQKGGWMGLEWQLQQEGLGWGQ
jgi:hypothetical protein